MDIRKFFVFGLLLAGFPNSAFGCDLCSIYIADQNKAAISGEYALGVAEQFTGFHKLQNNGDFESNPANQSMTSSITQLVPRYNFSEELAVQIAVPLIQRNYTRPEGTTIESGSVSGLGDISILAAYSPYRSFSDERIVSWNIRAGIKLPTGSTDKLGEETEEEDTVTAEATDTEAVLEADAEADPHVERIGSVLHAGHDHSDEGYVSAIHGHDLTLGTGSVDYIIGTDLFVEYGRIFSDFAIQYVIRTEGDYDYRFQNDLQWDAGAGAYLIVEHSRSLALKGVLSGEYKGTDVFEGNREEDTGINSIFAGPELALTLGQQFSGNVAYELPLFLGNTGFQAVPDYRVRVAVSYSF